MVLTGLKVLDLSKAVAGPHCSMLLADLGADVIKVEIPVVGDDTRNFKPALADKFSGYFIACNRNKKSITLNLKEEKAKDIFKKMLEKADVIIESMVPGAMERLGLGYHDVKKIKPDIIYCSVSGYGQEGPYSKKAGYELMAQAVGGMISVNGEGPDAPRIRTGFSVTDVSTSYNATVAILAAILNREKTGVGQHIDINLLYTQLSLANFFISAYSFTHVNPKPSGFKHVNLCPYSDYQAKDGRLIVGMSNEKQWKKFCENQLFAHLLENPHFKDQATRRKNEPELQDAMEAVFKNLSVSEIIDILDDMGIACAPINTIEDLFKDDYIRDHMLVKLTSPKYDDLYAPRAPFRFSDMEMDFHRYYLPELGEHTDETLADLGYTSDEIQSFHEQGLV